MDEILMRYGDKNHLDESFLDEFRTFDNFLVNASDYGHKIVPYAKKVAPKSQLTDTKLTWNEYAVETTETVTVLALGYSFNILSCHEMFYALRFVISVENDKLKLSDREKQVEIDKN